MLDETEYSMTLNRLQRAALIVGLVAIAAETVGWLNSPHVISYYGHVTSLLPTLVVEWIATAAFTIAAMVLFGTRWRKREKSS